MNIRLKVLQFLNLCYQIAASFRFRRGCASLTPGYALLNIFPGAKILLGSWVFVPPAFLSATLTMICNMKAYDRLILRLAYASGMTR